MDEVIKQDLRFKFVVDEKNPTDKPQERKAYIFSEGKYLPILGVHPEGTQTTIPKPQREVLQRGVIGDTEGLIQGSPQVLYSIKKIDYTDDGIFIYFNELLYPKKGFPYPEACQANNVVKRAFISSVRAFSKNPLMALLLFRSKTLEKFLHEFCSFAEISLEPFYWKPEFYSKTAKEIEKFITVFLTEIGFTNRPHLPGKIISHFFEFDDAYMLRLQDIMNETTKERLLENPIKEILRLIQLFNARESRISMQTKIGAILILLKIIFFIPKYRRAFKKAISQSTLENFQMEECDRYQVLRWDDSYKFLGRGFESRIKEFLEMHKGIIPNFNILSVNQ